MRPPQERNYKVASSPKRRRKNKTSSRKRKPIPPASLTSSTPSSPSQHPFSPQHTPPLYHYTTPPNNSIPSSPEPTPHDHSPLNSSQHLIPVVIIEPICTRDCPLHCFQ